MSPFEETKKLLLGNLKNITTPYMILIILSYQAETFSTAVDIHKFYGRLPLKFFEKILLGVAPKVDAIPFLNYIKRKKEDNLIPKIIDHLHCSKEQAIDSLVLLKLEGINVNKMFGDKK